MSDADSPVQVDLSLRSGQWLRRDLVVWELPADARRATWTYRLYYSRDGGLGTGGLIGGMSVPLTLDPAGLPPELAGRWPHLTSYAALRLAGEDATNRPLLTEILCGQFVLAASDESGWLVRATGVQLPGVLDDLFDASDWELGLSFDGVLPTLAVWAPTARTVRLRLLSSGAVAERLIEMTRTDNGVWSATGDESWLGGSYLYEVRVFAPESGCLVTNLVTDPYSVALTTNSARSVIVDLSAASLKPVGWDRMVVPVLAHPVDSTIYELHVRDFSVGDVSVPVEHRGGYLAFTATDSAGMRHLAELSGAGLNTVHLLPTFDFSTVDDVKAGWQQPQSDLVALSAADPAGLRQQAEVMATADRDGFNWGYDPWHYSVPEGSYATDPEGPGRTLEFRRMVAGLAGIGLRVVLDVVYNHTVAAGQDARSVLDRIVPGYYHRLSACGAVENSTCCANTAAEHAMMQKLIVDSVVLWARQYKVGGFRFDLMGHHPRSTMLAVRTALDALTPAVDGLDGRSIYVYGEGWNFGEVAGNARFVQGTQSELAGTGIGTFNDRLRDAVRGGGPFDPDPRVQGFGTGLFTDPNGTVAGPPVRQLDDLLAAQDCIKIGLTGNLRDFPLVDRAGNDVTGSQVRYRGSLVGYTAEPAEVISYVDAHDNETLFDALALKLPVSRNTVDRVRMNTLCLATVALGQGPMLWHAGTDLLRSKSLDRNSFNSGDWFNRIDWTGAATTFGAGLPPAADNEAKWPLLRELLADPSLAPGPAAIAAARAGALDLLRLRFSSPLFRLGTAALISERMSFPLGGPGQIPWVIVMVLSDIVPGGADLDPDRQRIVVVFNASPQWQTVPIDAAAGLVLHPVQVAGLDPIVRLTSVDAETATVPPRTVAVLQS